MTKEKTEPVTAEGAYEAGATLLLKRARIELSGRKDILTLFSGAGDRWFRLAPWSELTDFDREFWNIIADLLNTAGLGLDKITSVLEVAREYTEQARAKREATAAKCGKAWEQ